MGGSQTFKSFRNSTTVSVIIPTRNEEKVIHECLSSVFSQSLKPSEVIVVDGRSTDATLEIASQFPVRIINETEPTSLPHARNLGVENAKGDLIFLMDADVVLDDKCIENAVKVLRNPNIVAVIPSEKAIAHTSLEKVQIKWLKGSSNPVRMGIGILSFVELIDSRVFEKIRFDADLGFGEDADFQQRLVKLYGASSIAFSSDSYISIHYPHTLTELRSQWTWYGRTFVGYQRKHFSLKTLLNLGSLLAPVLFLFTIFFSLLLPYAYVFLVLVASFLVIRNLVVCFRSRSLYFGHFIAFEFARSFLFLIGLFQGSFSKNKGK